MYDLVKRGLGIGYFTKSSVINDIVNNDLFEIKTKTKLPKTETCLAYIPEFLGTASSKFIDFMMREIHKKRLEKRNVLELFILRNVNIIVLSAIEKVLRIK